MIDLIQNNPFRVLGVYASSSQKEIVANQGRMKAFLKVGKPVEFPLDLKGVLPSITRTTDSVATANGQITLANEKMKYGQFWFIKKTSLDDIAFNHLTSSNVDKAIEIWSKKDDVSSLQNRFIIYLIQGDIDNAIEMFCQIYEPMDAGAFSLVNFNCTELVKSIVGEDSNVSTTDMSNQALSVLIDSFGFDKIYHTLPDCELKQELTGERVKILVEKITEAIAIAKATKNKGITARYNAGVSLMNTTKSDIQTLKGICGSDDIQYQMIADKLGLEILQCGIDFYNDSEAQDAAQKAMKLQLYALNTVVGKMAKDRCKENVDILKKIIDNLPPQQVFTEATAIQDELRKFCNLPDKICYSITLLNNTKPYLQTIKSKLGATNSFYLKLSSQVVGNALHNLVEEVNSLQEDSTFQLNMVIDKAAALQSLKSVLNEAWKAIRIMDTFDMESDFRANRFNSNRETLKGMCEQVGISTYRLTFRQTTSTYRPNVGSTSNSTSSSYSSSSTNSQESEGMPGWLAYTIGVLAVGVVGAIFNGGEGFGVGCILGLLIGGPIAKAILCNK